MDVSSKSGMNTLEVALLETSLVIGRYVPRVGVGCGGTLVGYVESCNRTCLMCSEKLQLNVASFREEYAGSCNGRCR